MWTSQKSLNSLVHSVIAEGRTDRAYEFDAELKKARPNFHALLKNPPKTAADRELVRKAANQPITVRLIQQKICLSDDFIEEAIILNEMAAVELLLTAEGQQPSYPDLTRGLVAVLLYYDQQRCIVDTLRCLIEAREGRRWTVDSVTASPEVAKTINDVTASLWRDGLLGAILDLLPAANERLAAAKLEEQRALGNARHRRQFGALQSQVRHCLADCVFLWACQTPLGVEDLLAVMRFLQRDLPPAP
uniref:DUF4116 domain-containing protein n=1 Tax=Macrostomum lignano TaxID=282301 RepID=A0A1I8G1J1_9PLAT